MRPTATREQYLAALFRDELEQQARDLRMQRRAGLVLRCTVAFATAALCPPLALLAPLLLVRRHRPAPLPP